jgi:hypothetical protein
MFFNYFALNGAIRKVKLFSPLQEPFLQIARAERVAATCFFGFCDSD